MIYNYNWATGFATNERFSPFTPLVPVPVFHWWSSFVLLQAPTLDLTMKWWLWLGNGFGCESIKTIFMGMMIIMFYRTSTGEYYNALLGHWLMILRFIFLSFLSLAHWLYAIWKLMSALHFIVECDIPFLSSRSPVLQSTRWIITTMGVNGLNEHAKYDSKKLIIIIIDRWANSQLNSD